MQAERRTVIRIRALPSIPYAGVVLALSVMAAMAFAFLSHGMGVLFPFIQEDLNASRAQLGLIVSGEFIGTAATVLFTGWMADVIGVRRLLTASLIVVGVGLLLFSQIQSVLQGILVGVLIGVAFSGSAPANSKAIMDWVAPRFRGTAMSVKEATIPVGGMIAAGLLTFLAVTFDWRVAVIIMAIVIGASGLLVLAFYRDKPGSYGRADKSINPLSKLPQVLKNPRIWMATFYGATMGPGQRVVVTYLVLFLKEDLGMSAGVAGGLLAVLLAGGAAGRLGWALVSDLLLKGRRVGVLAMVSMLTVLSMALMAMLPSNTSLPLVALLVLAMGIVNLGRSGVYVVLIAELAGPTLSGTSMGLNNTITSLTGLAIAPLFGLIADRTGSYAMSWWVLAAFSGFGILMLAIVGSRLRLSRDVLPALPPE